MNPFSTLQVLFTFTSLTLSKVIVRVGGLAPLVMTQIFSIAFDNGSNPE